MASRTISPSVSTFIAAAEAAGLRVTVYRFEEWRQRGLVPRPTWSGGGTGVGSTETYPWYTKWQTIAAARAVKEFRNIDSAILALWIEGWPIEADALRAAATRWIKPVADAVEEDADSLAWKAKEASQYTPRGQRWKNRRGSRDKYSQTRYYEALSALCGALAGRGMSPDDVDEVMQHSGASATLETIFARAGEEHGPFPFDKIAENINDFNLAALTDATSVATADDYERARAVGRAFVDDLFPGTEAQHEFNRISTACLALGFLPRAPLYALLQELIARMTEESPTLGT